MAKETKGIKDVVKVMHEELTKVAAALGVGSRGAYVSVLSSDSLMLEVRYSFSVNGSLSVSHKFDGEGIRPVVETNFPSTHRSGMEMVCFAQLVQDLTTAAIRLQVVLDQFEVVMSDSKKGK